jgi:hypothetical protein
MLEMGAIRIIDQRGIRIDWSAIAASHILAPRGMGERSVASCGGRVQRLPKCGIVAWCDCLLRASFDEKYCGPVKFMWRFAW